jgi:hypothetical protein
VGNPTMNPYLFLPTYIDVSLMVAKVPRVSVILL